MMQILPAFPGGVFKAVTMSYDDGQTYDRRLIEIFNRYGIKSAFNLNSCFAGKKGFVSAEEIPELYAGHEVAVHSSFHVPFRFLNLEQIHAAVLEDRAFFEDILKKPVFGFAWPGGTCTPDAETAVKECGVLYARSCIRSGSLDLPSDLFFWHPSFRHDPDLAEQADRYAAQKASCFPSLFFVAGHSYEFEQDGNWALIENVCRKIGGNRPDIWYAAPIEIAQYLNAWHALKFSTDNRHLWNPSGCPLWITTGCCCESVIKINPNETVSL